MAEDAFSMKNLTTYGKYGQVENGKYVCIIKWDALLGPTEGGGEQGNEQRRTEHIAHRAGGCTRTNWNRRNGRAPESKNERVCKWARAKMSRSKRRTKMKIVKLLYIFTYYFRLCMRGGDVKL